MRQAARIAHVQAVGRDALKQQTRDGLRLAVSYASHSAHFLQTSCDVTAHCALIILPDPSCCPVRERSSCRTHDML
jgi:hypothetical protein